MPFLVLLTCCACFLCSLFFVLCVLKSLFAVVFADVSRRGIRVTAFEVKAACMGVLDLLPFKRKIQFWLEGNHKL